MVNLIHGAPTEGYKQKKCVLTSVDKRQHTNILWVISYWVRTHKRGSTGKNVSPRISIGWISSMRYRYSPIFGQGGQNLKHDLQEWAATNAFTLAFITIMFVITWLWIIIAVTFFGGKLH